VEKDRSISTARPSEPIPNPRSGSQRSQTVNVRIPRSKWQEQAAGPMWRCWPTAHPWPDLTVPLCEPWSLDPMLPGGDGKLPSRSPLRAELPPLEGVARRDVIQDPREYERCGPAHFEFRHETQEARYEEQLQLEQQDVSWIVDPRSSHRQALSPLAPTAPVSRPIEANRRKGRMPAQSRISRNPFEGAPSLGGIIGTPRLRACDCPHEGQDQHPQPPHPVMRNGVTLGPPQKSGLEGPKRSAGGAGLLSTHHATLTRMIITHTVRAHRTAVAVLRVPQCKGFVDCTPGQP
jgi:hypothetical protein